MRDGLATMAALQGEGKVRHFGLSNETAWGTLKWLALARETGAPEMATIQNEYSLLCRLYDTDLAEVTAEEGVKLLAYSPLAAGMLTGKYHGGAEVPAGSRMSINTTLSGRAVPRAWAATQAYLDIAARHGVDPVAMAIRWAADRPFMGSGILRATSEAQLAQSLAAEGLSLSDELCAEIAAAHKAHPLPY